MKHIYPAVFTAAKNGQISIFFPDLEGTNSQGDNLPDTFKMAKDSFEFCLARLERDGFHIIAPSPVQAINTGKISLFAH